MVTPEKYAATNYISEVTRRVYGRYQEILRANNAMDFDDLLMNVVILFDGRPDILQKYQERYQHLLVDEFQDTNTAQYGLIKRLAAAHHHVFAVGDSDQCFPVGTRLQTPGGFRPIEEIKENDLVIAASGRGATLAMPVLHTGSRFYRGELITVQTRLGNSFRVTPNHIIFARLGINPDVHFGDTRRSGASPWNAHRVSINNSDQTLRQRLDNHAYKTRKGRRNTWKYETSRVHYEDAQTLAQELARLGGDLDIITGAFLVESETDQLSRRFHMMPAGHLHPSMLLAVEQDGKIIVDEITQVGREWYEGEVYDLEVKELHNYLAEGIVVHNSIYRWRGADYRNINRFRETYPDAQMVLLEQNYRSTQIILDAAKAVIRQNRNRVHKDLFTERAGGEKIVVREAYDEQEEASLIVDTVQRLMLENYSPRDFAVMYRTNAQSRALEEAFVRAGIPYRLIGATQFYKRREIKDVVAYLRLIHNPADTVSFNRVINTPPRKIGAKTQEKVRAWAAQHSLSPAGAVMRLATDPDAPHPFPARAANALARFGEMLRGWLAVRDGAPVSDLLDLILDSIQYRDYLDRMAKDDAEARDRWANVLELRNVAALSGDAPLGEFLEQIALVSDVDNLEEEENRVSLLTLHAAKGLEFPVVFLTGLEEGVLPHARSMDDREALEEERRLFYVGLTRAEDRVYISHSFQRMFYGNWEATAPSRFLRDLPLELVEGASPAAQREQTKARASSWDWSASVQRSPGWAAGWQKERKPASKPAPTKPEYRPLPDPDYEDDFDLDAPQTTRYQTGQKVRHAKFGEGIVIESKLTGNDEEVSVAFAEVGIKRLAASFAKLEVIRD